MVALTTTRRGPEARRIEQLADATPRPPGSLVAGSVELVVMAVTERYGELIRYFTAHGARLGKAQVVGVRGTAATNEAGLAGDKREMRTILDLRLRRGVAPVISGFAGARSRMHEPSTHTRLSRPAPNLFGKARSLRSPIRRGKRTTTETNENQGQLTGRWLSSRLWHEFQRWAASTMI